MSARHNKNKVLKNTIYNIINFSGISKFTNPIDIVLLISNIKFADLAIILSICIEVPICYNAFSWLILLINKAEALKLINNPLNLMPLYYK